MNSSKRCTQPQLIQLSNYEQIIVIQAICSIRYITLLFIIYKGYIYILVQYKEEDILYNQKLTILENRQKNNALSLEQLKYFNVFIKIYIVGRYQLLILDSYKSYINQDFKDYYLEQKILILYILVYLLYIFQLLNIIIIVVSIGAYLSIRARRLAN